RLLVLRALALALSGARFLIRDKLIFKPTDSTPAFGEPNRRWELALLDQFVELCGLVARHGQYFGPTQNSSKSRFYNHRSSPVITGLRRTTTVIRCQRKPLFNPTLTGGAARAQIAHCAGLTGEHSLQLGGGHFVVDQGCQFNGLIFGCAVSCQIANE